MKIEWDGDETNVTSINRRGMDFEDNPFHTQGLVEITWREFMRLVLDGTDLKVLESDWKEKIKIIPGIFYG